MGTEPFIASIGLFGGNFAPRNWAFCNGQLMAISTNTALFSLIGCTFGGDCRTTFALPDLRGRVPIHSGGNSAGPGLPAYQLGQKGGTETTTLSLLNLPPHNHTVIQNTNFEVKVADENGDAFAANGNPLAARARDVQTSAAIEVYANPATFGDGNALGGVQQPTFTTQSTGSGQSFNNMQPYLAVNYCIALFGIFPSRN